MKRLWKWFGRVMIGLLGVWLCLVLLSLIFPVTIAQMALDRLKSSGLHGKVLVADIFRGELKVDRLYFVRKRPGVAFLMRAKEGRVQMRIWAILMGRKFVPQIHVRRPVIRVYRGFGGPGRAGRSSPQTQKMAPARRRLHRFRGMLKAFRKRAVKVGWLNIEEGEVEFVDHSRPGRTTKLYIRRLNTILHGFKGELRLKAISVEIASSNQKVKLSIPRAAANFDLGHFLDEAPLLEKIQIFSPSISIRKFKRQTSAERKRRLRREKVLAKKLRLAAPEIKRLLIRDGRLLLLDDAVEGRKVKLEIPRFDADLLHLEGTLRTHALRYSRRGPGGTTTLQIPMASLRVDLGHVLGGRIAISRIKVTRPKIEIAPGRRRKQRRSPGSRKKKWLKVGRFVLVEGEVGLSLLRKNRAGVVRPFQVLFKDVTATLEGFDTRKLLASPFKGKGHAKISGHGVFHFRAARFVKGGHRVELRGLPVSVVNQLLDKGKLPLRLKAGKLDVQNDFVPLKDGRLLVRHRFQVVGVRLSLEEGKKGLKRMAIRIAINAIHRYFEKHPEGYRLAASYRLKRSEVERPEVLFKAMGRHFLGAFFEALFEKHPVLARFRPMIMKRLKRGGKKRKGFLGRLKEGRERRKKRRHERRKKRIERRASRQEKRKKRREERRNRRKKRWEKLKRRVRW